MGSHCPNPLPRSVCVSMHRLKIWQLDLSLEITLVNSLAWLCSNAHGILCKPMNVSCTRKKKYLHTVQGYWNLKKVQMLNQLVLLQINLLYIYILWQIKKDLNFSSWHICRQVYKKLKLRLKKNIHMIFKMLCLQCGIIY